MITVEVAGTQYDQLESIEMGMALSAIARDFSLTVAQPDGTTLPFRGGEAIKIFIDGELRLDGSIFTVTPSQSKGSHNITMTGRSNVADLVDSSLTPFSVTADISLQGVIEEVIRQLGLSLTVSTQVSIDDFNPAEDKIGAEPGEGAFDFIDRLARKKQVLLTSDPSGNIVITRNGTTQNPVTLLNPAGGSTGNMISSTVSYDLNKRFNKYIVMSQQNGSASALSFNPASSVDQRGEQDDSSIRVGRQLVIQAEKASSDQESLNRAIWLGNIARVRSRNYSVRVQGTRPKGGEIWETNRLQHVIDDQAGIDEVMLIDSVRFSQSRRSGTITQLGLVNRDAYTVTLAEPPPAQATENIFAGF